MRSLRVTLVAVLLTASVLFQGTGIAHAETINLLEAHAFENVAQADDLLVFVRYELPTADWQISAHMDDETCVDATDLFEPCYTSLNEGLAFHRLYTGTQAAGDVASIRELNRVGHGLSAVYLEPGHGITFGNTTTQTCIEPGTTITANVACTGLQWHASDSVNDTPGVMDAILINIARNFEAADPVVPRTALVTADQINETGIQLFREAFALINFFAPGAFVIGVTDVFEDLVVPTPPAGALDVAIAADSQTSTTYGAFSDVSQGFFGMSARLFGTGFSIFMAMLVGMFVFSHTRDPRLAGILTFFPLGFGLYMTFFIIQWVFAFIVIMTLIGAAYFVRKAAVS